MLDVPSQEITISKLKGNELKIQQLGTSILDQGLEETCSDAKLEVPFPRELDMVSIEMIRTSA